MSTTRVDVGTQWTNKFGGWTTTEVCFYGFANLPTTRGEKVISPEILCFGHQWALAIYPGGRAESDEGRVAVALANMTDASIKIQYGYCVKDVHGNCVPPHKPQTIELEAVGSRHSGRCSNNFAKRSTIMDLLVDGSLIIELRMKLPSTDKSITHFIPTNPINKNVLQKFMDEESADVVFEVDNESCKNDEEQTKKKSKTITTFYAHRFILQDISTMLAELCKSDEGGITTVSITDVKPTVFKHMIYHTYGGKLSDEDLKNNAKDIIDACDKYGVVHLKLEAEACYVDSTEITMDNMMDNLLYADSKNLALLKEAVMDYIVANKGEIIGKVSFNDLPGSIATDLLTAMARGEETEGEGDSTDYNKMRVGKLRNMLDEKGLDVDGSREAMIALLKEQSD